MKLLAFDTETHLIQPGLAAPPLVCGSVATDTPRDETLLAPAEALAAFRSAVTDPETTIGGASLSYDFGIVSAADSTLVPLIFQKLDDGLAVDTKILEKLHIIGSGGSQELDHADNSLAALETKHLGIDRSAQKLEGNGWRLSYALLENVPLSEWPADAIQYPRDDARGTHSVLKKQLAPREVIAQEHDFYNPGGGPEAVSCTKCGTYDRAAECTPLVRERLNLQCLKAEMQADWFLRLASIWGMRTDPGMVPTVVGDIQREHEESRRKFFAVGIVRVRPCNRKEGEYERADAIGLAWLNAAEEQLLADYKGALSGWVIERLEDIEKCRKALIKGRPIRFAEDKGRLAGLVAEAYHGDPPLTEGGASGNRKTSTSRDTLVESGDGLLEAYGEAGSNEKLLSTYVDVLNQGTRVPICPEANSLVATQRTSYRKPNLQQLPRGGWVRYCFVPRGYEE